MDEDKANEEQPTSSRKESQRVNSGEDNYEDKKKYEDRHDSYDDKRKYDERRKYHDRGADAVSNTESFTSSYSARSRIEVTEANANVPKPPGAKREKELRERHQNPKKKRTRHSGKVHKRGRSMTRRRVLRKAPRRKPRVRKDRAPSVSTIFTRISSRTTGSQHHEVEHEHGCNFCGHRCCRRR